MSGPKRKDTYRVRAALKGLEAARNKLRALGFQDAVYCPKDGSAFQAVCFGSTGIFSAYYDGDWPDGQLYLLDGGEVYPTEAEAAMWRPKR